MEWLLLLLLGSLAAGTVYWTTSSRTAPPERRPGEGEGPQSSPELPERQERSPVIEVRPRDIERLRDMLQRVEEPVKPQVVDAGKKDAKQAVEELKKELRRRKKPLSVSFTTDQLIPRSSPHAFHRRPLQNAEQFVAQQLADEALKLFERVERRVPAEEIKEKIRTNIEDIRRWMEGLDGDEDEPVSFPEIIVPLTSQAMALEDLSDGLRRISETLARDIANALRSEGPLQLQGDLGLYSAGAPAGPSGRPAPSAAAGPPAEFRGTTAGAPPAATPPTASATPAGVPSPPPTAPTTPPGTPPPTAVTPPSAAPAVAQTVAYAAAPAPAPPGPALPPGRQRVLYLVPRRVELPGDAEHGVPGVSFLAGGSPTGPAVPTGPQDALRHAGEEFQFDEAGHLLTDGMTDEDFKREWEKYKALPLVDRRAADERRFEEGEGAGESDRPDRRAGADRRRNDLFEEREEFLARWKRHEERKLLLEQRGIGQLPDADVVVASYDTGTPFPGTPLDLGPAPLEPVGLPAADSHPLDQAFQEAEELLDHIHAEARPGTGPGSFSPEELPPLTLPDPQAYAEPALEAPRREAPFEQMPTQAQVEIVQPPLDAIRLPTPEPYQMAAPTGGEQMGWPPTGEAPREGREEREEPPAPGPQREPEHAAPAPEEPLGEGVEAADIPEMPETPEPPERGPVQEIRGVLELKPPDEDDAPFLTLTYDFGKIPDSFKLSRDYHTMEFAYYKYKPMLIKAQEFARRKMLKSALNYYRVIKSQNIPPEFRRMVNRNIQDITDYLEKFMMSRSGD